MNWPGQWGAKIKDKREKANNNNDNKRNAQQ
jgi:hypothetical protein